MIVGSTSRSILSLPKRAWKVIVAKNTSIETVEEKPNFIVSTLTSYERMLGHHVDRVFNMNLD